MIGSLFFLKKYYVQNYQYQKYIEKDSVLVPLNTKTKRTFLLIIGTKQFDI